MWVSFPCACSWIGATAHVSAAGDGRTARGKSTPFHKASSTVRYFENLSVCKIHKKEELYYSDSVVSSGIISQFRHTYTTKRAR
jgi:hypothetical protein